MNKNRIFAVINLVIKSLMIGFLVLIAIYTIYFLYLQFFVLPHSYALYDGKGTTGNNFQFYCSSWKNVYRCGLFDLIVSYFGWMFFYLLFVQYWFKYYLVQLLIISACVLSISVSYFIKNYEK
jgi:hypothetical protein